MTQRKTWEERIAAAEERGYFTRQDYEYAGCWNSCAVGEKLEIQSLNENAAGVIVELIDGELEAKGKEFYNEVAGATKSVADDWNTEFNFDYAEKSIIKAKKLYEEIQNL